MDSAQQTGITPGIVTFVGAGPGDPDLMTIKGRKAIEQAALVLYAGSLVPREVVAYAAPNAMVVDSAPLNLEQCHALVRATALAGRSVARVHTGDPSLYGALREQAALLDADGIPWRVVPGVTAACAAAAAAYRLGLTDPKMFVQMPGGTLELEIDGEGVVHMTGDVGYVGAVKLGSHFTEQLRALK